MKNAHFVILLASAHVFIFVESRSLKFFTVPPIKPCLSTLERKGGESVMNCPMAGFKNLVSCNDFSVVAVPLKWRMQSYLLNWSESEYKQLETVKKFGALFEVEIIFVVSFSLRWQFFDLSYWLRIVIIYHIICTQRLHHRYCISATCCHHLFHLNEIESLYRKTEKATFFLLSLTLALSDFKYWTANVPTPPEPPRIRNFFSFRSQNDPVTRIADQVVKPTYGIAAASTKSRFNGFFLIYVQKTKISNCRVFELNLNKLHW